MTRLAPLALVLSLVALAGCTGRKAAHPDAGVKAPAADAGTAQAATDAGSAKAARATPADAGVARGGGPPEKPWPKGQPKIDVPVKDFTLKDTAGRAHGLYASLGRHGAVVVFVSDRCPYSTAYDGVLARLARRYHRRGLNFLAIDANADEPAKAVAAWKKRARLPFPVLLDSQGTVAKALGARGTPDAYLIGAHHRLRYHGSIGNSMNPLTDPRRANATDIEPAIRQHLAGHRPENPIIHSFGCPIRR